MQQTRKASGLDIAGWSLVLMAVSLAAFTETSLPVAASFYLLGAQALLAWAGFAILLRRQSRIVLVGGGLLLMCGTVLGASSVATQVPVAPSVGLTVTVGKRLVLLGLSAWMAVSLWRSGLLLAVPWLNQLACGRCWLLGGVLPFLMYYFGSPALAWALIGFVIVSLGLQVLKSAADITALRHEIEELRKRAG